MSLGLSVAEFNSESSCHKRIKPPQTSELESLEIVHTIVNGCVEPRDVELAEIKAVDIEASEGLFAVLYDELHRMAQRELRRNAAVTLSPTTLLHETFLNVSQRDSAVFSNRARFMAYAARAMRGLVVDYLRSRHSQKRGGEFEITSLPDELPHAAEDDLQIEKLNEALDSLAKIDTRLAECVDLKFFCGFSFNEIARMRDVSERTIQRDWDKARLLLNRFINGQTGDWVPA